jgi:hypothetical protein
LQLSVKTFFFHIGIKFKDRKQRKVISENKSTVFIAQLTRCFSRETCFLYCLLFLFYLLFRFTEEIEST